MQTTDKQLTEQKIKRERERSEYDIKHLYAILIKYSGVLKLCRTQYVLQTMQLIGHVLR